MEKIPRTRYQAKEEIKEVINKTKRSITTHDSNISFVRTQNSYGGIVMTKRSITRRNNRNKYIKTNKIVAEKVII